MGQQAGHSGMAMQAPADAHVVLPPLLPPMVRSTDLAPFVDRLPLPAHIAAGHETVHIAMREAHAKVHRDLPATRMWLYLDGAGAAADVIPAGVSPVIEARSGQPLRVRWTNELPTKHFLPIDFSLHGCGRDLPEVRTVAHLHGARVPTADDGYPTDWFVRGQSRTCTYPMEQDATMLWYHDHAMGLNRLNTYAGMAGMTMVRDEVEDALELPRGAYEIPLVLADRYITPAGELFYPTSGDPEHPWVPEFYADTVLVNGKILPFVEVEPRMYRLRVLNAANSLFFALGWSTHEPVMVIGGDQGLLERPARVRSLLVAPAERADVLVDFSALAGQKVTLNHGVLPVMQFRVGGGAAKTAAMPEKLRVMERIAASEATVTRTITLEEMQDAVQNPMVMLLNRKHWHEPVTELPKLGATEIWEFVNLTEDTHPMHLHLVRFSVLNRQTFEPFTYQTFHRTKFLADPVPPGPEEAGWKDVVQCPPGMITRIVVRFDGYAGKYLYHCHVLEHEANDMMRPFEVLA